MKTEQPHSENEKPQRKMDWDGAVYDAEKIVANAHIDINPAMHGNGYVANHGPSSRLCKHADTLAEAQQRLYQELILFVAERLFDGKKVTLDQDGMIVVEDLPLPPKKRRVNAFNTIVNGGTQPPGRNAGVLGPHPTPPLSPP